MTRSQPRRILSSTFVALATAALIASSPARTEQLSEVERICSGEKPRYGRELDTGYERDRTVRYSHGDVEYDRLSNLLPEDLKGWGSTDVVVSAFSSHILGCGLDVRRTYRNDGRELLVSLMFGPLVDAFGKALADEKNSPRSTYRPFRFEGRSGIADTNGLTLIAGRALLTIAGPAAESDKRAALEGIDLNAIEAARP